MGIFENVKKQAEKAVGKHGDKIAKGIDKAASTADSKTSGKHTGHISKGASAAKDALAKLDGKKDENPDDQTPQR